MKRLSICFGLVISLLAIFATSASAGFYRLRFNVIKDSQKPGNTTDMGDCNMFAHLVDLSDANYPARKTDPDLNSDFIVVNPCQHYTYHYLFSSAMDYSLKENALYFYDEKRTCTFKFFLEDNQVKYFEIRRVKGKVLKHLYVQTDENIQQSNRKVFDMLMDMAKTKGFERYKPRNKDNK